MPLISVVVQCHNSAAFLREALASVRRQAPAPLEVLVVDDGSTDDTAAIASQQPDVTVLRLDRCGLARARTRGVQATRGDLVAFLDGDDVWAEHKLARQMQLLSSHPDADGVVGLMRRFLHPGAVLPPGYTQAMLEHPVPACAPGALLMRRRLFDDIGAFDATLSVGADADWLMRAFDRGRAIPVLDEVVLHKRLHAHNISSQLEPYRRDLLTAVRRSLVRRGHLT